ncbi:MAG: outer membrane protein assembly factor BamA [Myxococcota bacterium]
MQRRLINIATVVLVVWALLLASVGHAEVPEAAQGQVVAVKVEGTRRIEDAVVLAAVAIRRGQEVTASKVRRDLRSIHATGFFEDVIVRLEEVEGGVEVVYEVVEKPAVREVRLSGNKKIDEDDIREQLDVRSFTVLNEARIKENVTRIRDLYVEKGFDLAEVDANYVQVGADQVDVVFEIVENRKVVVQRIDLVGNDRVADKKIRRFLRTKRAGPLSFLGSGGTFRRELLEQDREIIRQVYLEEGFLDARIDPPKIYLSPDKRYIFISFAIEEGEPYTVGTVDVAGDFVPAEGLTRENGLQVVAGRQVTDIQEDLWRAAEGKRDRMFRFENKDARMQTGEKFVGTTMFRVLSNLETLWSDQGYAFVNIIPDVQQDRDNRTADVTFRIEKGEKVRVGRIEVIGNDPTFDKVVRREIQINEGDVYRGSLVKASKARLLRLGFFENVDLAPRKGDGPDVLDLTAKVTERPTGTISLGLGYSNLESLVVNGSFQKNNWLGLGFGMNAAINWSRLRRQLNVAFVDPFFLDSRWTLSVNAYWQEQQFQAIIANENQFQRGGSITIGRYLDPRDDIQLSLQYTAEDVGLSSIDEFRARLLGGDLYRNGLTSQLGVNFIVDKRNDRIFPTQGFRLQASTALAGGFKIGPERKVSLLGGDFNFVETQFNFRLYQPLLPNNNDRVVFRLNSSFGDIRSTDGRIVPFIHRYRAGGIQSLRGFQWFSLGPSIQVPGIRQQAAGGAVRAIPSLNDDPLRAVEKLIVGGTQTWVNNIEVEAMLVPSAGIAGVVFFDAGNAFVSPFGDDRLSPFRLRTAVGGGIRWRSPIGPLRFEIGFPLRPRADERQQVFDFGIGSFF